MKWRDEIEMQIKRFFRSPEIRRQFFFFFFFFLSLLQSKSVLAGSEKNSSSWNFPKFKFSILSFLTEKILKFFL